MSQTCAECGFDWTTSTLDEIRLVGELPQRVAEVRDYSRLSIQSGIWSLEEACRLVVAEAAMTDPTRTYHYHDWRDSTAAEVVGFLAHEAAHHLYDLRRLLSSAGAS